MAEQTEKAAAPLFGELGVSGLKVFSGYVDEEFLQELKGPRGMKTYRQMAENDSTISAVLTAIDLLIRAADWSVTAANDSPEAEEAALFAQSLMDDMNQPFEDFVSEALSMLPYGWSYFETVMKRRVGPTERDPRRRSKYTDGKIGIRKLAIRSQDTLGHWQMQDDGGIAGMWQMPPTGSQEVFIPIEKALLFRTSMLKNNPEGKSILRQAYRSWYILKTVQNAESIGIERELAGLPVARIPADYMKSDADSASKAFYATIKQIVRDLKFNAQGGVVVPSDYYPDENGNPTSQRMVEIELLSTGGRRAIDTNATVLRYQRDIARAALADFIMLGTDGKGSYALSQDKTDLFLRACETYLNRIASVMNRILLPRVWDYNGMNRDLMPEFAPGNVAPTDLGELGTFIESLSRAGAPLFPDPKLEGYLRDTAGLPEADAEAM